MNEDIKKELAFIDGILGNIRNVKMPVLVYDEEKEIVRKALLLYKQELESKLRGKWKVKKKFNKKIEKFIKTTWQIKRCMLYLYHSQQNIILRILRFWKKLKNFLKKKIKKYLTNLKSYVIMSMLNETTH